tara:strand:- start:233 stop:391 length:159 start_codon:yes stop_codon:yes gene_type:complete
MELQLLEEMVALDQVHLHYQVVPLQVEVVDQLITLVDQLDQVDLEVVEQELM